MTRADFWSALNRLGLSRMWVCLDGPPNRSDVYVLESRGDQWCIYYGERGARLHEQEFPTESDALRALLAMIRADVELEPRMRNPTPPADTQ